MVEIAAAEMASNKKINLTQLSVVRFAHNTTLSFAQLL